MTLLEGIYFWMNQIACAHTKYFKAAIISFVLWGLFQCSERAFAENNTSEQNPSIQDTRAFGPQSPRNINQKDGHNKRIFSFAPHKEFMNLCNIHLHHGAEHMGGEFTKAIKPSNKKDSPRGYAYAGTLTDEERAPITEPFAINALDGLNSGDTIEVHFVLSSSDVRPGPTLASCLEPSIQNTQLRVVALIAVLTNDGKGTDFANLTQLSSNQGYWQSPHIPNNLGIATIYQGSTTGPDYNNKLSPFQVTWEVYPKVLKVDAKSIASWFQNNPFDERHAHGVRTLIRDHQWLSKIK